MANSLPEIHSYENLNSYTNLNHDIDHDHIRGYHRAGIKRTLSLENHHERDRFNNYLEYLLTILGYAAGFGSVWRFPYLVYKNGGGVFLIPYLIMLFLIGIPSFYFETALGQMLQKSPPQCFEKTHKKFKGLGIFPLLTSFSMSTYYNLILGYSFYFLYESFSSPLPWTVPKDSPVPWNSDYFYKEVLQFSSSISEIGHIIWPLLFCYVLSQVIVYLCIQKGVAVSGRVAMVTATSPYILLFLLLVRGLFLPGSWQGIKWLFMPDWSKLSQLRVWVDATNQAIFQVSTGGGVLVLFGSYRPISQEIKRSSYLIPLFTVLCGFLASMVIFSFMGYMSHITNIPIDEIPLRGPDLAFIVFPAVLTKMPFSNLLAIIFFIIMIFLGIDTQFAFMDGLAGTLEDELNGDGLVVLSYRVPMKWVRALVCGTVSLFGFLYCTQAGFYYLDLVDTYGVGFNLFMGLFIEVFFFTWIEKWEVIEEKVKLYIQDPTPQIFIFLLHYSVPFFTASMGLLSLYLQITKIFDQPWWCTLLGWFITVYPYFIVYYFYNRYKDIPYEQDEIKSPVSNSKMISTKALLQEMHEV
ncbi:hypothetical protein ABPG74_017157 [Tetrahymena malaccensis]